MTSISCLITAMNTMAPTVVCVSSCSVCVCACVRACVCVGVGVECMHVYSEILIITECVFIVFYLHRICRSS